MSEQQINQLIDHLFRHQSGKMVSVLTRIFGTENIALAEDVVQDSLIEAIQHWSFKGIPANPTAWLFKVAKNKALTTINREKYKDQYTTDAARLLQSQWTVQPTLDHLFSEKEVLDDQLRMMFTCCHPVLSHDSQIALILKTLCGFSIPEIAKAFLTSDENINKRLVRARQKIRDSKIPFEVPTANALAERLQTVLETIYLLFNEGYSAHSGQNLIRFEVCEEAIRLTEIIIAHKTIDNKSDVYALLALMQLNMARFKTRQDKGNIVTLEHQDRSLWDFSVMEKGFTNLNKSVTGAEISVYHILASISSYHCSAANYQSTDWESILVLYNKLLAVDNSPVVLLNRAIAVAKVNGIGPAITELEKLKYSSTLQSYYLFYSVQAEFYIELNQYMQAIPLLERAIELTPNHIEKIFMKRKLAYCNEKIV
ncbi:MAG TPA: sigma-70 family RNA polymerase sigma factor [Mucilaginibacter sp.]|nr:sigma-70 family RNA polymerase sigma factor [Mucilaginibacter sp.]